MLIDESRKAGMHVALECNLPDLGSVPEVVGRTAFRIVQEGLTNARKHADHAPVSVAVRGTATDGLTVESGTHGQRVSPAPRRFPARV
jgi:signal transduction histidine kinase